MATDPNQISYAEKHRKELELMFKEVLGNDHVYYAPPESVKLVYDCIVYEKVS